MGNAYQNASLIVTPNAYKASKIYALKPDDGSGDLSFSRAGSKMVRNSSGLWETIGTNIPPLHYPVGGGCPSWLFEAEATNEALYSNDVSNATWGKAGCTITYATSSYFKDLNEANVVCVSNVIAKQIASTSIGSWVVSVVIKKTDADIVLVDIPNGSATGSTGKFWFTFSTETITQGTGITTLIEKNNGNYRFQCVINVTGSGTHVVYIYPTPTTASVVLDANKGMIINYLGFETGSVATSPIITAGSSVTRLRDVPQIFTSINGLTNFSVFFDITPTLLNNTMLFGSYSSGGTNSHLYYTSANSFLKRKDGTELNIGAHGMTLGTRYKIGYVVSGTTIKYFRNGALIFTSTIDGTLFDLASIWSSKDGGGSILPIRGICKDSILYQTALSDSEAIALTTI